MKFVTYIGGIGALQTYKIFNLLYSIKITTTTTNNNNNSNNDKNLLIITNLMTYRMVFFIDFHNHHGNINKTTSISLSH